MGTKNGIVAENVFRSDFFFKPITVVEYDYGEDERIDQVVHLKDLKAAHQLKTYFQDAPKMSNTPEKFRQLLRRGQCVAPIKFFGHRKDGEFAENPEFFFVYQDYDAMLAKHQESVSNFCVLVEEVDKYQVRYLMEVPVGGVFGLKLPEYNFTRVRITEINFDTHILTYWAMDEGKTGTCTIKDLLHLSADCLRLTMLVIPGVFEKDPTPDQLKKFEAGKFCLGIVTQPKRYFDHGPRKIRLAN